MEAASTLFKRVQGAGRITFIGWGACLVLVFLIYHLLSDGDFSFLLTLGGIMRLFGLAILCAHIIAQKSCAGLSGKTVQIYTIVFVARLCSVLKYEGYLPYDKSGDWLYQFVEVCALGMACVALYLVFVAYRGTYDAEMDAFGAIAGVPSAAGIVWALVPCFILSMIFHPSLNGVWVTDVLWTFACYLETLALFPQLMVFSRMTGVKGKGSVAIEAHISHFVFAIATGRMMHFIFWLSSFHELNDKYHETHVGRNIGWMILIAQVAHLVMLGDYFYYYITAALKGTQMVLPDRASDRVADAV